MKRFSHYYLVRIQFLGFRYHGWQKQQNLKTVHGMVDKTLAYILGHQNFKTLGCGRTDAMVSAQDYAFELFLNEEVSKDQFLLDFDVNLPDDIHAISMQEVAEDFNIISSARTKEYHYYFTYGRKFHPFGSAYTAHFPEILDTEAMASAASLFQGTHHFKRFAEKTSENAVYEREIYLSEVAKNDDFSGTFLPENTFVFRVSSSGFLRHQVRLMMGALYDVGKNLLSYSDIENYLSDPEGDPYRGKAPASGLSLYRIDFD